jgi:putative phage-type endonuclease
MHEQGTPEWFAARCGKATASKIADIVARTKTGWGASRTNYAAQLVAERLTGTPADSFSNSAMQWGVDNEAGARRAYAFYSGLEVVETGFIDHPTIAMSGASPDGLVGADGLVELKCPNTSTHIATLLGQSIPDKYEKQMLWQMACTGRQWCDFASYDPRLPESMRLFVKRLDRDDAAIAGIEAHVIDFLDEVAATVASLRNLYEQKEAA